LDGCQGRRRAAQRSLCHSQPPLEQSVCERLCSSCPFQTKSTADEECTGACKGCKCRCGKRQKNGSLHATGSLASDFARIPQDLWLNGTITGIRESGLLVLVEPPVGSIGGPRTGLVMRQNALDSIGGPRVGLALHQNAVVDNAEASDGAAAEKDLWSRTFIIGGEVQVRVKKITSKGHLFLSMREILGTTDVLEAIVTNVTSRGLSVSVQPPDSDEVHHGFVPANGVSWDTYQPELFAVGQKVKVWKGENTVSSNSFSMLEKQDVAAWKGVPRTQWFQGIVADTSSEFTLMNMQLSNRVQPVLGVLFRPWEDGEGNRPNLTVGQPMWVRVSAVYQQTGKLTLTAARVKDCTWFQEMPAGTWLNGTVRRPCSDGEDNGWIVRVEEPVEGSDGSPGRSCRAVLPHPEVEGVLANHATVQVRLLSTQGEAQFTMKE